MIGQTVSHYLILELLGGGGMGVVYKAEDTRLKRIVALKFLPPELTRDPEVRKRFIREAQTASALQHNNICTVHDIDQTDDGQLFIVMELYEGETLKSKIERGPQGINESLAITMQIAQGLARAHEHGIVHRDIKPANIFVTTDGTAKLLDFGLAKLAGPSNLTIAKSTVGTLAYMSPEQIRGLQVDQRTDIWSLGVVLYEMLSGRQPFKGEYDPAIMYAILEVDPEPIETLRSDIPAAVAHALVHMLAKDPAGRYQRIDELIAVLQPIQAGSPGGRPVADERAGRHRTRKSYYIAGAIAICGILAVMLFFYISPSRGSSIHSLVVIPFRNTSGHLEDTVFAEGMTEALSTELSKVKALVVRSSRSAMRFKHSDVPLSEIARELNVDAIVDGSTQRSGNNVRVSVNLIKANPEQQLWGENYKEEMEDINTLQSKVAQAIVHEIRVVVTPEEHIRLAHSRPVDVEAYQACVYGRFYWNKWTPEGFQRSLAYFQAAARKDPSYAPAYAGLADVYATLWYNGTTPFRSVEQYWRPAAQKAVQLDANLAESHVSLAATRLVYDWDWAGAEQEITYALSLNPSYATGHHWYALLLSAQGRHDSAISEMRLAEELDPLSVIIVASGGWMYMHARRYDEAIVQFRRALELDSLCAPARSGLGEIYESKGKNEEALWEYLCLAKVTGGSFATIKGGFANAESRLRTAYKSSGWQGYWTEELSQLQEIARKTYVSSFHIAAVNARLQRRDEAFQWLEKAYQERSTNIIFCAVDPNMENLKGDPRYEEFLKRIGLILPH